MLSILGALLGFGTSFLPKVMDYFQDKQDKKHELEVIKAQTDSQIKLGEQRMEMAVSEAHLAEIVAAHKEQETALTRGAQWLANLSGSVRPVVTYAFVIEFLAINGAIAWVMLYEGGMTLEVLGKLLSDDFMALLSAMIAFWFGTRQFGKGKNFSGS